MVRPILVLMSVPLIVFTVGCGNSEHAHEKDSGPAAPHADGHKGGEGHSHIAPHGGIVKTVGQNHVELTFDATNGTITFYMLGDNE